MRFGVLGPLQVLDGDGAGVPVSGLQRRRLLGALLLRPRRPVAYGALAAAVWDGIMPRRVTTALHIKALQLRRLLEADPEQPSLLVSVTGGYCLSAPEGALDVDVFEELAARGTAALARAEPHEAARLLHAALEVWRGDDVLTDVPGPWHDDVGVDDAWSPLAGSLRARREEVVATRRDADLLTGADTVLLEELRAAVAAQPLDERVRAQLLRAYAALGRQADAVQTFHDARRALDEQLGVQPGPELRQAYQELLEQAGPVVPSGPATADAPGTRRTGPRLRGPLPGERLPRPTTSFVGRDGDLARVLGLLTGNRLVTLTGPGGVGKTRLAAEAAGRLAAGHAGAADAGASVSRVVWVGLEELPRDGDVAAAVAAALGADLSGSSPAVPPRAADRARAVLATDPTLLVLDNCEHVVARAAQLVDELVAGTDDLLVLCTSRESLGLPAEVVVSVPSLGLPQEGTAGDDGAPDVLGASDAGRLLAERVEAARGTPITAAERAAAASLVRSLDGIPLAIELAAARVRALGVAGVASQLGDRFSVLGGRRGGQPRQQTMEAVIDWSWQLLDDDERHALMRFSVFRAPADLDAAERVVGLRDGADRLVRLVEQSMLLAERDEAGSVRYRALGTVRAYAADQLAADPVAEEATRQRHLELVEQRVLRDAPSVRGADQAAATHRLSLLSPDVDAALAYCQEHGLRDRGARLAAALGWYWYLLGRRGEGRGWLRGFAGTQDLEEALCLAWSCFYDLDTAAPSEVLGSVLASVEVVDQADAPPTTVSVVHGIAAVVTLAAGDPRAARRHRERVRAAARQADDHFVTGLADLLDGLALQHTDQSHLARESLTAGLEQFAAAGDRWGQVQCLLALAALADDAGDGHASQRAVESALAMAEALHLDELRAVLLVRKATTARAAGDAELAGRLAGEAEAWAVRAGAPLVLELARAAGTGGTGGTGVPVPQDGHGRDSR